jgi:two-component system, NarL family, nitrate/nitrite response regulator NarL
MKKEKTRILLVDDNRLVREGIAVFINGQPDLTVVKAVRGGRRVLQYARALSPRVILLDLGVQDGRALQLLSALRQEMPRCKVIGMGLLPTHEEVAQFVAAGASGFIATNAKIGDVLATIRAVARGKAGDPPQTNGLLFTHIAEQTLVKLKGKLPGGVRLTRRERQIVIHIAKGLSHDAIAHEFDLSLHALRIDINNILEKMALYGRLQVTGESSDPLSVPLKGRRSHQAPLAKKPRLTVARPVKKTQKRVRD